MRPFSVVSLFAGCGGLDIGVQGGFTSLGRKWAKNPFKVVWANDFDENATKSYAGLLGKHIVCGDINEVLAEPEKYGMPKQADIVTGGFPCQPFSHAGKRLGLQDRRGNLYLAMRDTIERLQPLAFVAENVRGILTIDSGETIKKIVEDFGSLGYRVNHHLYHVADYDVPQTRERVLIVGIRNDLGFEFSHPKATTPGDLQPSVESAIEDLAEVPEGAVPNHFWSRAKRNLGQGNTTLVASRPGPTMRAEHHGNIEFHYRLPRRLSAREAARIQSFPDELVFQPSTSAAYKQVGNAVPPVLGWHVARSLGLQLRSALKESA